MSGVLHSASQNLHTTLFMCMDWRSSRIMPIVLAKGGPIPGIIMLIIAGCGAWSLWGASLPHTLQCTSTLHGTCHIQRPLEADVCDLMKAVAESLLAFLCLKRSERPGYIDARCHFVECASES